MKNRFRSIWLTFLFVSLFFPIYIFSQGGGLYVYPNSPSAYPTNHNPFVPGTATQNDTLNGLFVEYGVYRYDLSFPGAITPSIQNAHSIGLTGDPNTLKDTLERLGYFNLIEIQTTYIENDSESSLNFTNGCPNPWTPNDPGVNNWANELIEVECA